MVVTSRILAIGQCLTLVLLCQLANATQGSGQDATPSAEPATQRASPVLAVHSPVGDPTPFLRAQLESRPPQPGLRTAVVEWDAGAHASAQVEVSMNGGTARQFARGRRGAGRAEWIDLGSSYIFRLYDGDTRAVLATARVAAGGTRKSLFGAVGALALFAGVAMLIVRSSPTHLSPSWRAVLISLGAVWIGLALAINPAGEFPLNDDWAYAWSVSELLQGRGFHLSDWAAVNLFPQVLWGALFCLPAGVSFTALRLSTLVAGLLGLYSVAYFLRCVGVSPLIAAVATLTLALNPIYLALSYSFNSDVPSVALFAAALFAIAQGLEGSPRWLVIGIILSVLAVLERQTNLVLLPALGAAYLTRRGVNTRSMLIAGVLAGAGFAVQAAYVWWLDANGRQPALYGLQTHKLLETLGQAPTIILSVYVGNLAVMAIYLGLFLLPLSILTYGERLRRLSPRHRVASVASVAVVTLLSVLILGERRMPLAGNVLERGGIGPQHTGGYYVALGETGNAIAADLWAMLTVAGIAGAAILGGAAVRVARAALLRSEYQAMRGQLTFAVVALLLLSGGTGGVPSEVWFDRYLLPFVPLCAALLVFAEPGAIRVGWPAAVMSLATLLLFGSFSATAVHDMLGAVRARWHAYEQITNADASVASDIAEWDFNGWRLGQRIEWCNPGFHRGASRQATWDDFSCLAEPETHPLFAAYETAGQSVVASTAYFRWLPPVQQPVYILRRPASAGPAHEQ